MRRLFPRSGRRGAARRVKRPLGIAGISPASATAGDGATPITVTGYGFTAASIINVNGSPKATTFVNATTLTATLSAGDLASPGFLVITVSDASYPATSSPALFPVQYLVPTTSSLSPSSVFGGGGAQAVVITGTGFYSTTVAQVDGVDVATTFTDSTHVTATVPAGSLASPGSLSIRVRNPLPGGGPSNAQTFTVNAYPVPTTVSLAPASVTAGAPATPVVITGTNFLAATVGQVDGVDVATSFSDATHVTATIPAASLLNPGTLAVRVRNPAPGGGPSNAQTFTVNSAVLPPYAIASGTLVYWLDALRYADVGAGSAAWTYGTMGPVVAAGTTPPTVTLSGTATAAVNLRIEITAGGALGAATYRLSLDGGITFPTTGTTSASEGPFSGITVAFGAGTYTANNTYASNVRINAATSRESAAGTVDALKTAFQSTVTNQPRLVLSDPAYGGKPSLDFSESASVQLATSVWGTALAQPSTYFFVGRYPMIGGNPIAFDAPAGARNVLFSLSASTPFNVSIGAGSFPASPVPGTWTGSVDIVVVQFNGAATTSYLNTAASVVTSNPGTQGATRLFVGGGNTGASGWRSTESQIVAFSGALTLADINTMASFLASYAGGTWTP